ncbi:MAG: serine/threonine protein kinase [Alphaproteobacteria bacterium]|nr:serine/threonine protein kinase [Alphaproteobacteria bacterium]
MRELLGAGSFGEVYLATMASTGGIRQEVAVKILAQDLDPRSQPVERLRDEGRILGALNHPVILQVRDLVVLKGRIGLVTEYVPGADLQYVLEHAVSLDARVAMLITGHVGDALDAAFHAVASDGQALHLVHRDIKPANLRVTPHGTVKLLDFGIAKAQQPERETATSHLVLMGSLPYMAPEVVHMDTEEADMARDVYALGCTLFEMLTGELFFLGLKRKDVRQRTSRPERYADYKAERLAILPSTLPPPVIALVDAMLAYAPAERPTARQVADRAHEIADELDGPSLRRWAHGFPWPPVTGRTGAWSGKRVTETTFLTHGAALDDEAWVGDDPLDAPLPRPRPDDDAHDATAAELFDEPEPEPEPDPALLGPLSTAPPDEDTLATRSGFARAGFDLGERGTDVGERVDGRRSGWFAVIGVVTGVLSLGLWLVVLRGDAASTDVAPPDPTPPLPVEAPASVPPAPPTPVEVPEAAPVAPPAAEVAPDPVPAPAVKPAVKPAAKARPERAAATPAPTPEPAVVAPAAVEPAPAKVAYGTVRIVRKGDFPVELRSDGRTSKGGRVTAGTWEVWADFGAGLKRQVAVSVGANETVTVQCRQILAFCEKQ